MKFDNINQYLKKNPDKYVLKAIIDGYLKNCSDENFNRETEHRIKDRSYDYTTLADRQYLSKYISNIDEFGCLEITKRIKTDEGESLVYECPIKGCTMMINIFIPLDESEDAIITSKYDKHITNDPNIQHRQTIKKSSKCSNCFVRDAIKSSIKSVNDSPKDIINRLKELGFTDDNSDITKQLPSNITVSNFLRDFRRKQKKNKTSHEY